MKEHKWYRDNLEQVLEFSEGKQMLNITEVVHFTGLSKNTVKRLFPFSNGYISAATLARCMCTPGTNKQG